MKLERIAQSHEPRGLRSRSGPRRAAATFLLAWAAFGPGAFAATVNDSLRVFDEVCGLVQQHFHDASFAENAFPEIAARHRERLLTAPDGDLGTHVNDMLAELETSHTHYFTPDDYGYYHLAAIFRSADPIQALFPDGVTYETVGIITERIDDRTFVVSVLAGSRAEEAGLLAGDEIVSADGRPFGPIASFRDKAGRKVKLRIRRKARGRVRTIKLRPEKVDPKLENLDAERESVRVVDVDGHQIGYIHVWSYAGAEYQEAFEDALRSPALASADGLVWDLRFGWGGASPDYLRVFGDGLPVFEVIDRAGRTQRIDSRVTPGIAAERGYPLWTKPAVMLVNDGTRSGKELLAHGFRSLGIGKLVGETTRGATTAGRLFVLSNRAFLYLAVMDTRIDGVRLEGRGVAPHVEVPHDVRYAAGADPQYDKALEVLVEELSAERAAGPGGPRGPVGRGYSSTLPRSSTRSSPMALPSR